MVVGRELETALEIEHVHVQAPPRAGSVTGMATSLAGRCLHISAARGLSNRNWTTCRGPRRRRLPYTPGDAAHDARDRLPGPPERPTRFSDRPGEVARARHALRAAAGRPAGTSRRRLRQGHVLRRVRHRTRPRLRRRARRLLHRPVRGARPARQAGDRSRRPGGARHAAQRRAAHRRSPGRSGMPHAAGGSGDAELHARAGREPAARPGDSAVADGRCAAGRGCAGARSTCPG